MRIKPLWIQAGLAAGLLGASGAVPADDDPPRFGGGIDVVAVDAKVVDGRGQPVRDIALEEFSVKVDGKRRRVLSAKFSDLRPAAATTPGPPVERGSPVAAPPAVSRPAGRLVILVVDRGELSVGGVQSATQAAALLLDRLSTDDRVAIFSLPAGPRLDFTSNRAELDKTLGRIGPAPDVVLGEKTLPLKQRLDAHLRGATDRLNALEALLGPLAGIPGGKVMVLISGGFTALEAPLERDGPQRGSPFGISGQPASGVVQHLRRIAIAAAAARTSFYSFYISDHARAFEAAKALGEVSSPLANPQYRAATLETLTAMGGGAMFEIVAGAGWAFERVAEEMSGEYLLGLEPAEGDRDGKPHDIEVKVRRMGVDVRARRQFVIAGERATPPAAPPRALQAIPPSADTPAAVQAQRRLREGQQLMARDDFEGAARVFEQAIALDPHRMMAHYGLGTARMGLKEYPSAIVAFQAARDAFHARAAEFAWLQGQVEHARADRVAAVGNQVRNENRAQFRDDVEALERLREEGKESPQLPPGLSLALGSAYFRTGQLADAEREYRAAIEAQPKLGEPRSNLAVVLLLTGHPAEAKEQLKLAKKSGFKPPAGLEADIEAALAKAPKP